MATTTHAQGGEAAAPPHPGGTGATRRSRLRRRTAHRRGYPTSLVAVAFLLPALAVYLLFVVFPAVQSVNVSLYDWSGPGRAAEFVGLGNYAELASDPAFYAALRHNIVVIVASAVFQLPLGMALALLVTGTIRGRRVWRAVYFLPTLMSTVAIGILWRSIYNPTSGLLNGILGFVGLDAWQQGWLGQSSTALGAVMATTVWQFAPFYMIIYSAAIVGLPAEVFEAAKLDGAGPVRQLFSITLPMLKPVILTTVLLSVVGSIKFFDLVYVMTGGGPNGSTELLATYMFRQGFLTFRFGYASAIATAMLLLSLLAAAVVLFKSSASRRIEKVKS